MWGEKEAAKLRLNLDPDRFEFHPDTTKKRCLQKNSTPMFNPLRTKWTKKKKKCSMRKPKKRVFKLEKWVDVDFLH